MSEKIRPSVKHGAVVYEEALGTARKGLKASLEGWDEHVDEGGEPERGRDRVGHS